MPARRQRYGEIGFVSYNGGTACRARAGIGFVSCNRGWCENPNVEIRDSKCQGRNVMRWFGGHWFGLLLLLSVQSPTKSGG